ncbi:MAG TPA: hypothetical protein VMK16_02605 [Acidimicrobiales bacterium]|nr:hypothetical protein [Acidimicrobiales bacterium]
MRPDSLTAAVDLKRPIQQWTRGWMLTKATDDKGVELGLRSGRQFWICGRAGVLGDADAAVAASALAFIDPDEVRELWESLPPHLPPRAVAAAYAERIFEWGDRELPRFGDDTLERLDDLSRHVIDAAPCSLGALFAGWRAMPVPATLGARVALTMHVMREMRGAAHIVAITATGLSPLQAVLASPAPPPRTGPEWAEHLGWRGPFEDPALYRAQRDASEDLTNEILARYFDVLSVHDLADFSRLLAGTRDAIDM